MYRRKAVVRDWFGNGNEISLKGKMEMIQQSEYDVVNVEVQLDGLQDVGTYNIHKVSHIKLYDSRTIQFLSEHFEKVVVDCSLSLSGIEQSAKF